ncbi:hypothetical protein CBP52_01725 [Cellulomonas sp. PSBB021]|nr:hypothetical protein CBP52_01725 [Cellulomonas sp. PSBB021]
MATVHRAHDVLLERDVALKVFPVVHGEDELMRNRAEVLVLAALSHPALVMLYDAGAEQRPDGGQQDYLVMELVDGPTLSERLRRVPLDRAQAARVGRDLAEALAVVHAQGVIHRDIKPGNILLTGPDALEADASGGPAVKLADFGIARLIDGTRLTRTGQTLGTVLYLSPEQARGEALAPSSDIYSLGLVLLECLTGRPAFPGTTTESAVARLISPPHIPDDVDPELAALLTRMTLMTPDERPSADEVATELAALGSPDRTLPLPATPARRTAAPRAEAPPTDAVPAPPGPTKARRRHPRRALLSAGAALLLTAGGLLVAQQVSASDGPSDAPSYPAVEGRLGTALTELQKSVQP